MQDSYVLRVGLVPLWLSGIRTSAVNEQVRPKLEKSQWYQRLTNQDISF